MAAQLTGGSSAAIRRAFLLVLSLSFFALSASALSNEKGPEPFATVHGSGEDSDNIKLDPSIRDWVLLPILIVMFLQGVIRDNMAVLLKDPKKSELKTVQSMAKINRSKLLRANGHNLPLEAYKMRKRYFTEKAFKAPEKSENEGPQLPQQDPTAMMDMMKQNMGMGMLPNMLLMGWTSYFFSGFVLIRLPFSLTDKFKPMLQRGIQLRSLDVSYVSSLSWYFMLYMGLRGLFSVVLGANRVPAGPTTMMKQQVQGPVGPVQDFNKMNEAEKTELEIHHHEWVTPSAEDRIRSM